MYALWHNSTTIPTLLSFFFLDLTGHNANAALTSYASVINCGDTGNQSFKAARNSGAKYNG